MTVSRMLLTVAAVLILIGAVTIVRLDDDRQGDAGIVHTAAGDIGPPRKIAGGDFEASGVAHLPGTHRFLFVDDDSEREIYVLELLDGVQRGVAVPLAFGADVTDMEGVTSDGRHFYVVGSQSKTSGFDGDGLVRFVMDPAGTRVSHVERIQGLKTWLAENVPELHGTANRIGDEVLNIEGLAWDPDRERLLLGLRAPLVADSALVIPIRLRRAEGPFAADNLQLDSAAIRLDLGGAGIRGIEYDPATRGFLVITGAALNDETRDFRILEWDGVSRTTQDEIAAFPRQLKPEGIARAQLGGSSSLVVVFDAGAYLVMPRR